MSLRKYFVNNNDSGFKLMPIFLFGVFVGAVGVIIALNLLYVITPVKKTQTMPIGGSSFNSIPPAPPSRGK